MVTFLTVLVFLGPKFGYRTLMFGRDIHLHLICPLLSLLSYLLWDNATLSLYMAFFGTLPVILYGCLYLKKVVFSEPDHAWEDFYGFNKAGKWPISFAIMVAATFILSIVILLLGNRV